MTSSVDLGIPNLTDIQLLGRGGFSIVYSAVDAQFARRVAVKVLTRVSSEADRRRFERECEIMGRLSSHANVVTVYSGGYTASGDPYLVMELVDGGSLADTLRRSGPLPWRQAVGYIVPVARALAEVHRNRILHRDLKPDNILLAGNEPRLTDFGISSLRDFVGPTSTHIAASLGHAPPETYSNHRDERSDIYSLASTLYELVSGSAPIVQGPDEPIQSYINRTLNEPPRLLGPSVVPPGVDALLQRCLAKDPEQRCQSADEFATELEAAANAGPGPSNDPSLPAPPTRAIPPVAPGSSSQPGATGPQPYAAPQPSPVGAGTGGNGYNQPGPTGGFAPPDAFGRRPDSVDMTMVAQGPGQPPAYQPGPPQNTGYQAPPGYQPQPGYQPPVYQPAPTYQPQGFTPASGPGPSAGNRGVLIGVLGGLGLLLVIAVVALALSSGDDNDNATNPLVDTSTPTTVGTSGSSVTTAPSATTTATVVTTPSSAAGPEEIDAFSVEVGNCLAETVDGSVQSVTAVDCSQPHQTEVYHAFDLPEGDGTFPAAAQTQADDGCLAAFEGFVGRDYDSSIYYISTLIPTDASWAQLGDREVLCLLGQEKGTLTTGSAQGTGL